MSVYTGSRILCVSSHRTLYFMCHFTPYTALYVSVHTVRSQFSILCQSKSPAGLREKAAYYFVMYFIKHKKTMSRVNINAELSFGWQGRASFGKMSQSSAIVANSFPPFNILSLRELKVRGHRRNLLSVILIYFLILIL